MIPYSHKIMNDHGKFDSIIDHSRILIFKCGSSPEEMTGSDISYFKDGQKSFCNTDY